MHQPLIDFQSFSNVDSIFNFYSIEWEKSRISLIRPLNYIAEAANNIFDAAEILEHFLETQIGLKEIVARFIAKGIVMIASAFEVVSLTIAKAQKTNMNFTPNTANTSNIT